MKEKRTSNCESIECIQYREFNTNELKVPKTKEEAEILSRMYAHGIMNMDDDGRLQGAIQYGGTDYLDNDVLVVRKPYTSVQSELTYTVFERLRAGLDMPSIFGASNASREQAKIWGLLEEYNRNNPNNQVDLTHLSHSLGVSSTKNAMNWANYKGMTFNHTTLNVNTVGTSYPMTNDTVGGRLSMGLYDKPIVIAGGFGGGSELVGQLIDSKGDVTRLDLPKIGLSTVTGIATKDMGAMGVGATNGAVEFLDAYRTGKNPVYEAVSSTAISAGSAKASGMIKDKINPKFNPKSNEYKFEQIRPDVPIYKPLSENQVPSIIGNAVDNIVSKIIKNKSDEKYKELVDEKNKFPYFNFFCII